MKEALDFSMTEEEIAADVLKASAMAEGSENELDEPRESKLRRNSLPLHEMALMQYQLYGLFNKSKMAGILWTPKKCEGVSNKEQGQQLFR